MRRHLFFPIVALLAVAACTDQPIVTPDEGPSLAAQGQSDIIPGQYIVVFNEDVTSPAALAGQLALAHGLTLQHTYQHAIKGFSAVVPEGALVALQQLPFVQYIEPNQYSYINTHERLRAPASPARRPGPFADGFAGLLRPASVAPVRVQDVRVAGLSAPSNLTAAAISSGRIDLSWSDNSNGESGTKIERCQGAACTNFAEIAQVGSNVTTYSDLSVAGNTTYRYRVRAYKDKGKRTDHSGYSNIASATTPPAGPPLAPSNLTATPVSSSQIDLAWTDNSNNETGFRIERCTGAGCTVFVQIAETGPNVTSYSDMGLAASTTYRYRVRAFNSAGNSAYSNIAEATTQAPPAPPAAPSSLTAMAVSSSQINLAWTDNSGNEDGFRIERCQDAGCTNFGQIAETGANVTSHSDMGLQPSTTYRYRVRAFNAGGNSGYSNIAEATTEAAPACSDTGNHDNLADPGLWGIVKVKADQNAKWQATQNGGDCAMKPWFFGLDTGVDSDHPDLNVAEIKCFLAGSPGCTGEDGHGHGTHTAGTVAAIDGNGGVVGVAPGARIYGFKVCTDGGSCPNADIIAGIDEVTARKNANPGQPMVANMSLGGGASNAIDTAVRESVNAGVVYSISAGNGVFGACFFPADAQNVSPARVGDDDINASNGSNGDTKRNNGAITTTSSTQSDNDANCNFGHPVTIGAPGVGVKSTWLSGGYNTISGTSMAAPHSAGAAVLYLHDHLSATPTQVEEAIVNAADAWTPDDLPNACRPDGQPVANVCNGRLNVQPL